jgi:hypothetical protein
VKSGSIFLLGLAAQPMFVSEALVRVGAPRTVVEAPRVPGSSFSP